jgi:hypothetical protein
VGILDLLADGKIDFVTARDSGSGTLIRGRGASGKIVGARWCFFYFYCSTYYKAVRVGGGG